MPKIAIVGVGCKFPGAENLDEFWRVLENGENHVLPIPKERWNNDAFYSENKDEPGKIYVNRAGFLKSITTWDPLLYGISEVEAKQMDPQQRVLLDCVHMAMEDGGFTNNQLNGSKTGVYIGAMNDDYSSMCNSSHDGDTSYTATGLARSILSARISYVYNLQGPCLVLDTACSSGLIGLHLGSQAILTGDCNMAICGGVNCILSPETFIPLCRARMMSTIGQCQTFCDSADGYARGEGCGVVILKSLEKAIEDGNKIWATIQTASNQDGHTATPITAPSSKKQMDLLKEIYGKSDVTADQIQYIEAHGTGTKIADPTETNTLGKFFSDACKGKSDKKILIGSVKTNIGHTESAAGIAGIIKCLLMMKNSTFVRTLHINKDLSNLNPEIKLENLELSLSERKWEPDERGYKICCVNSFGFGGSNSHAILQSKHLCKEKFPNESNELNTWITFLSAREKESLKKIIKLLAKEICQQSVRIADVAFTSGSHRNHYSFRVAIAAKSKEELRETCLATIISEENLSAQNPNLVFVFGGVGTTWDGMGSEMMNVCAFNNAVSKIDFFLKRLSGITVSSLLKNAKTKYSDAFLSHIAIFAIQIGIFSVWNSYGIIPNVIVGQSVGEVAAAYAAGILDLETAVNVIYFRSKILAAHKGGKMMFVKGITINEIETLCKYYQQKVTIAVFSSPIACTLSGDSDTIHKMKVEIESKKEYKSVFLKILEVDCAYHSYMLDVCIHEIERQLSAINGKESSIDIWSTVSSSLVKNKDMQCSEYWAKNVRQPVLFYQTIQKVASSKGRNIFLEIGPKQVLKAHLGDIFKDQPFFCYPSMGYKKELSSLTSALCHLYKDGVQMNFSAVTGKFDLISIPRYVSNNSELYYLPKAAYSKIHGAEITNKSTHMYVEQCLENNFDFALKVNKTSTPFAFDHYMSGALLVPGATYGEAAFQIGKLKMKKSVHEIMVSIELLNTLSIKNSVNYEIFCRIEQEDKAILTEFVHNDKILCNAKILLRDIPDRLPINIQEIKKNCENVLSHFEVYDKLKSLGFEYGPSLRTIQKAWYSKDECLVKYKIPKEILEELNQTNFHPSLIDGLFQMFGILELSGGDDTFPKSVEKLVVNKPYQKTLYGYGVQVGKSNDKNIFNSLLLAMDGSVIAEIQNFTTQTIKRNENSPMTFELSWKLLEAKHSHNVKVEKSTLLIASTNQIKNIKKYFSNAKTIDIKAKSFLDDFEVKANSVPFPFRLILLFISEQVDDFHENAILTFQMLKDIISILRTQNIKCSFYVISRHAQCINTKCNSVNLHDSSIWGMIRCVIHEEVQIDIKLIDIDDNVDASTLLFIFGGIWQKENEFVIRGKKVFVPRLVKTNMEAQSKFKKSLVSLPDNVFLKSKSTSLQPSDLFIVLDNQFLQSNNQSVIKLDFVCFHNAQICPNVQVPNDHYFKVWPEKKQDGFQIFALEGCGKMTVNDKKVYFCFPIRVASNTSIPTEYLYDFGLIKKYTPGMLTLLVCCHFITTCVPEGMNVGIVTDSSHTLTCFSLHYMLHLKHFRVTIIPTSYIKQNCKLFQMKIDFIILTGHLSKKLLIELKTVFEKLQMIITLPWNVPSVDITGHNMFLGTPKLNVIHLDDCFSTSNLLQAAKYLRKIMNTYSFWNYKSETKYDFTMQTFYINELEKMPCLMTSDDLFCKYGCYIVVGGLTGLGFLILKCLIKHGAGVVVTMSRHKPIANQQDLLNTLMNKYGCKIICIQVDITSLESLQMSFKTLELKLEGIEIRGVFHGAGILSDSFLSGMTEEKMQQAMLPKIRGSWNLHIATLHLKLDYFVMHSSIVSILGNAGQTNYGAGNSFVDSLAFFRRSLKLAGQSINWGALDVGMAKNSKIETNLKKRGFNFLKEQEIEKLFINAVLNDPPQVIFGKFDWTTVAKIVQTPKLELLAHHGNIKNTERTKYILNTETFLNCNETEKKKMVFDLVQQIGSQTFACPEFSSATMSSVYKDYGVDSMAALSFVSKIFDDTGCKIAVHTILSDDTTIGETVENICQNFQLNSKKSPETNYIERHPFLQTNATIPFTEYLALQEYFSNRNYFGNTVIFDIEMKGLSQNFKFWSTVLKHVVAINPHFQRLIDMNDNVFEIKLVQNIDVALIIEYVSMETISNEDKRVDYHFNLNKDLPIRFQIAFEDQNQSTKLRVICPFPFHDLHTLTLLSSDIRHTAENVFKRQPLPEKKKSANIPLLLHTQLANQSDALQLFWNKKCTILQESLQNEKAMPDLNTVIADDYPIVKEKLENDLVKNVFLFLDDQNITIFNFFASVYQIFLHRETKMPIISLMSSVDVRGFVSDLRGIPSRLVSIFPLIGNFESFDKALEFVVNNSKEISDFVQNSLYPLPLIKKEILSEWWRQNLDRHWLTMNDLSSINKVTSLKDLKISFLNIWHSYTKETSLFVEYDKVKKQISFLLSFNKIMCGSQFGDRFMMSFKQIIKTILAEWRQKDTSTSKTVTNSIDFYH